MDSLSNSGRGTKRLPTETQNRIQLVKNGLVLQVATKKGQFWEEVRMVRARWGIEAPTQLPPEDTGGLYPGQLLPSKAKLTEQYIYDSHNWEQDIERLRLWLAVPGLERYREELDWRPFLAALALYQPPLDAMPEFAEYGGMVRVVPNYRRQDAAMSDDPLFVRPLIRRVQHPYAVEWAWQRYYEALMEEINERFLKPRGLNIQQMKAEVLQDGMLDERLQEHLGRIPQDLYIAVPKYSTVVELREAASIAAQMREEPETAEEAIEASRADLARVELAYRHFHLGQEYLDVCDLLTKRYPGIKSYGTFMNYARAGKKQLDAVLEDAE